MNKYIRRICYDQVNIWEGGEEEPPKIMSYEVTLYGESPYDILKDQLKKYRPVKNFGIVDDLVYYEFIISHRDYAEVQSLLLDYRYKIEPYEYKHSLFVYRIVSTKLVPKFPFGLFLEEKTYE